MCRLGRSLPPQLIIPVSLYQLNYKVKLIQPKNVIPAHYNTWELIAQDPDAWKKRVESETAAVVHVMQPDSSLDF